MIRDKLFVEGVEYKEQAQVHPQKGSGEGQGVSILSWNVECLRTCLLDIDFISFIEQYDLIFCSVTWQTSRDSFELSGYECFDVPRLSSLTANRRNRGHGGICCLSEMNYQMVYKFLKKNPDGFLWVQLDREFFDLEQNICICFTYIPPKDSKYYKLSEIDLFETLETGIRQYSSHGSIAIMGDINARTGQRNDFAPDSHPYEKFIDPLIGVNDNFSYEFQTARSSMDPEVNSSGLTLLDICKGADIRICNGRLYGDADIG